MADKTLVTNVPRTVSKEIVGEFTIELNDFDEISISNKYEPITFVLSDNITDFATAFNKIFDEWQNARTKTE